MVKYRAYQIAFDEESIKNIDTDFAIPIVNKKVSPFFENQVISDIVTNHTNDVEYVGVFSHKFFHETVNRELKNITIEEIKNGLNGSDDVVSFFAFKKDNFEMFRHAERVHQGIEVCYQELFRLFGHVYNPNQKMRCVIYRNAFFAKVDIYKSYVNEMLNPCIALMSDPKNEKLFNALWKDSKYPYTESRFRKHPQLRDKFLSDMGVPYYPFHTFVLERMFSYWLNINPEITCKHI